VHHAGRVVLRDVLIARMPRYAIISGIARSPHSLQQDRLELTHAELEERVYPGTSANVLVGNEEHWIIQFGYGPKHAHEVGVRGGIDRGQGRETGAGLDEPRISSGSQPTRCWRKMD
jgi:hypothetical protein